MVAIMLCYICGRICDMHPSGLCDECRREVAQNNEQVMILALLNEAQKFCPLALQNKIEYILIRVNKAERLRLPQWVREKS